jgi:hypothetical protein
LQITHRVKKLPDIFGRGAFFCLGDQTIEVLRLSHPLQNGFDIGFGWLPLRRFSGFAFYQTFEPIEENV